MAQTHRNDHQDRGMKSTSEAAMEKIQRKFLLGKPTRQEVIEPLQQLENNIRNHEKTIQWLMSKIGVTQEERQQYLIDNTPGMKEWMEAQKAVAAEVPVSDPAVEVTNEG